jgi:hypothetical protein
MENRENLHFFLIRIGLYNCCPNNAQLTRILPNEEKITLTDEGSQFSPNVYD